MISMHLRSCLSTFLPKYSLQNIKNSLVAKRTIHGRTLGRPLDSWVAIGDRATVFQQHCSCSNYLIFMKLKPDIHHIWYNFFTCCMYVFRSKGQGHTGHSKFICCVCSVAPCPFDRFTS